MILRREGRLQNSEMGTGDILSLELHVGDVNSILDSGYSMTRFVRMGGSTSHMQNCQGWAADDKIHVSLKDSRLEKIKTSFSLSLDPGGDLWFDLFDDALEEAGRCEQRPIEDVLMADPSGKIRALGITAVKVLYLDSINNLRLERLSDQSFGISGNL